MPTKSREVKVSLKPVLELNCQRMSRRDLENMIHSKMIEIMTNRAEIERLSQKVDSYQQTVERWQARAEALSQQCADLAKMILIALIDLCDEEDQLLPSSSGGGGGGQKS